MRVLLIDNYDSFVYNLAHYLGELGAEVEVYRNDQLTLGKVQRLKPKRIVISPGPGTPTGRYFGVCSQIISKVSVRVPTLGVCLGHQGIIQVYGGKVVKASRLMHGKTSPVMHDGRGIFEGVKNPLEATRYHSLVGEEASLPSCLEVSAKSLDDGEVMAVRHRLHPVDGIQFHPESILTQDGKRILKNFLEGMH